MAVRRPWPGGLHVGKAVLCQTRLPQEAGGFWKSALEGKRCLMEQLRRSYAIESINNEQEILI